MEKALRIFLFQIVFITTCVFLYWGKCNAANEGVVNFKIVCKNQRTNCSKMEIKGTKEEILVENDPVLTLTDISSAKVVKSRITPQMIETLKARGVDIISSPNSQLHLIFKNYKKLEEITSRNVGQRIAIIINGDLIMAPNIREPIKGNEVVVSSQSFTEQTVQSLSDEINKAIRVKK